MKLVLILLQFLGHMGEGGLLLFVVILVLLDENVMRAIGRG